MAVILKKRNSKLKSAHLVACRGHHGRLKECNQTRMLSVFFGLSWLSIDILPGSKWLHLQNFLWSLTLWESVRNQLPTSQSVR